MPMTLFFWSRKILLFPWKKNLHILLIGLSTINSQSTLQKLKKLSSIAPAFEINSSHLSSWYSTTFALCAVYSRLVLYFDSMICFSWHCKTCAIVTGLLKATYLLTYYVSRRKWRIAYRKMIDRKLTDQEIEPSLYCMSASLPHQ